MNRRGFLASIALTAAGLLHAKFEKWLPPAAEWEPGVQVDDPFEWHPDRDCRTHFFVLHPNQIPAYRAMLGLEK